MTLGEKIKKLRTDNELTQDELAEKIYVTRAAISKWETNKGYPNIDSLKLLSNLFHVSIDELISNSDVENKRLLDDARGRKFYWAAVLCLALAVICAIIYRLTGLPYLNIICSATVVGYIVTALLSKPKYKRIECRKAPLPYVISRLVMLAIILVAVLNMFI